MHSLLLGLFLFGSPSLAVPAGTPIRLTGVEVREGPGPSAGGIVRGRLTASTPNTYTVDGGPAGPLTFARPGQTVQARLVSADPQALTVMLHGSKQPARIPLGSVRDVRISRRRVPAWGKGAEIGGAALAAAMLLEAVRTCGGFIRCDGLPVVMLGSAAVGAGVGALVGAAIGRPEWEPVEPGRLSVAVGPRRGGLGVSFALGLPRRTRN